MKNIIIKWEGPFNQEEIIESNKTCDYGLYQVYGIHRIYGNDVLLYIGKAKTQSFGTRLPQHTDWFSWKENKLKFYLGKITYNKNINDGSINNQEDWDNQIDCAEIALIHYCQPAWNSANLNINSSRNYFNNFTIHNFGNIKDLPINIIETQDKANILSNLNDYKPMKNTNYGERKNFKS
jgi:hypothetical protein